MRIGFFVPRCTPENSHGRYVIELTRRLAGDHEVVIYSGAFWQPLQAKVSCRFLPVFDRPTIARLTTLWISSILVSQRRQFDIVHIQGADAPAGNVVTAHCCNAAMKVASGGRQSVRRSLNYALGSWAEWYCLTKTATCKVIAVSRKVKCEIEGYYRVNPEKIVVIPHGVDPQHFHPRDRARWRNGVREGLGITSKEFVILYVGGDYRLKGLLPLLEAVRYLKDQTKILAVGVEPDQFLLRLLDRKDQKEQIRFVGSTTNIAPYYAAADCFVLPTLYDTFSLATLEAMACGLPVIVSQRAGVSEILQDGKDGLLLKAPWNPEELPRNISLLLQDEGFRINLGLEARKTAEQHTWDRVMEQTRLVYRQAVEAQ